MIWRGEVYQIDLGQPVGHEPALLRPGVVVSSDLLNNATGGLVVVPVTTAGKRPATNEVEWLGRVLSPDEVHHRMPIER